MGIGKQIKRMAATLLAAVLAASMLPAAALGAGAAFDSAGVGVDDAGTTQMAPSANSAGQSVSSNVFVEVDQDAFEVVDRSPDYVAADVSALLGFYGGRIWVQTQGGTSPLSGTWDVTRDGVPVGTFASTQAPDGTWGLDLTSDGAASSLKVEADHLYSCTFTATDAQGRTVSACVTFMVSAGGAYGAKTVYKDHDETFDGVATYTEPSVTGIIHKQVQHLAATKAEPLSPVYAALMAQAAAYAADTGRDGAYAIQAAWNLETHFTFPQAGDPDPYKGRLSVVIPLPNTGDAPAVGEAVTVFGFDGAGAKEVRTLRVEEDDAGNRYVSFDDATLGAYAVCTYIPKGATGPTDPNDPTKPGNPLTVQVTGVVDGPGFMNYEGTYTWPKKGAIRYTFTPVVPGAALSRVEVDVDGVSMTVPSWAQLAGYYDLDLEGLPEGASQVTIRAIFVTTGGSTDPGEPDPPVVDPDDPNRPVDPNDPDDPMNKDWKLTVVTEGSGSVQVSVAGESASVPYTFRKGQRIELTALPSDPSQSIASATLTVNGEEIPLNVVGGVCGFQGPGADAVVRIVFSGEPEPPVVNHTVTVRVEGGHGSVDELFAGAASTIEAVKSVAPGVPATFSLFPETGYALYTVQEGTTDVGAYAHAVAGGYSLSVPDVGRDRVIVVRFTKAGEELPPVVVPGTFVTINVAVEAVDGLASSSLPSVTPQSVSVPKGAGYDFYVIPASAGDAELAFVRAKGDADLTWRDITKQASWVVWPTDAATGYWLLKVEGVNSDTQVRVGFRPLEEGEDPRPPTRTRNITINVVGDEWGAVFPNTVGKPPLKVPVGKTIVVTVVTKEGYHYEVRRADDVRSDAAASAGTAGDIAAVAPTANAAGNDKTSTEIIGGSGDEDENWEFVFGPNGGSSSSSSSSSSAGSSSGSSAGSSSGSSSGSSAGSSGGSSGGNQGGSSGGDIGGIKDPSGRPTVTPIVVADGAGRTHGRITPSQPFTVARGGSASLAFSADAGYRVVRVEVNGQRISDYALTGCVLRNIQRDTTVRVTFAARAETDSLAEPGRTVHRLRSLAKTGDLTPPAITCLAGVACAAAGVAFLLAARRRRTKQEAPEV
ncbi:hypothetical protein [Adlercreutzia murintestinalis]|uniref:hypothetical protein n=1 Tax=Adlercreutzia murintestinalis TaxID=2941325 RepID=UPI00203F326E|nr:hypothetical protein [Adlercreutzia murintestinalis]